MNAPADPREHLRAVARALPARPGVYRMLGDDGTILYIGKARDLKRRVASYLRPRPDAAKTHALMTLVQAIDVTVTNTETEALLLENELIKHHQPRYNVLLRDDKSYPWIHVTTTHKFPRIEFHRGPRRGKGKYFGPFPSAPVVRDSIQHLQKLFQLRNCEDTDFSNRSRPCLQHQIERCSAPCVGLIAAEEYARDVEHALMFLEGRNEQVVEALVARMEVAAAEERYELAARLRDQVARLRQTQAAQWVARDGGDLDVVAVAAEGGQAVAAILHVRGGRVLGHRTHVPKVSDGTAEEEIVGAFVAQYYLGREAPALIVVSRDFPDREWLESSLRSGGTRRVRIQHRVRGDKRHWLDLARGNASQALAARLAGEEVAARRIEAARKALGIERLDRIECFDASHTQGEATVVSCVVLDRSGLRRDQYRRFNITDGGGDDYDALREALRRRYLRLQRGEAPIPELLLIDGGRAQQQVAQTVLNELEVGGVTVVGIAKGADRRPGQEQLFLSARRAPLILAADDPALHLLQQVRDEAHRFALAGHRQQRAKARTKSVLESIAGLGPKKRQALLRHFGGIQAVAQAAVEELVRVPGINVTLAGRIHELLNSKDGQGRQ